MLKTKIICTLGPASSSETVVRKMLLAGMDVARLNFSHGRIQELLHRISLIRSLNAKYGRRIKLLGDLQGHRIRIGSLAGPIELKKRQIAWLIQKDIKGAAGTIPFDYQGPLRDIRNGQHIFIDDGNIDLEVIGHYKGKLKTKVMIGGLLKEHKGVNIPEAKLEFGGKPEGSGLASDKPAGNGLASFGQSHSQSHISLKDRQDILFCEKHGVEYVAQSFVRTERSFPR